MSPRELARLEDESFLDEVATRYRQGEHIRQIAKAMHAGNDVVIAALDRRNVPRRTPRAHSIKPDQYDELVRRYRGGESMASLAEHYGVKVLTLGLTLRRAGIEPRRAYHVPVPDATVAAILAADSEGMSLEGLARLSGRSVHIVKRVLKERGRERIPGARRERHGKWAGGRVSLSPKGYIGIRLHPDDPFYSMANSSGYVPEHRLVMAKHLGRPLAKSEEVHHKDGDHSHNDLDNLQLRHGNHGKGVALRCRACGSRDIEAVPLE